MNHNVCARHCLHAFSHLILQTALLYLFYRWGNWGSFNLKSKLLTSLAHSLSKTSFFFSFFTPHFLLEPFKFSHDLLWLNSLASFLHIPLLYFKPYFSTALGQPPISKRYKCCLFCLGHSLSHLHLLCFRSLTLPACVMGSPQGFLTPLDLSTILVLITLSCNQLLTHLSTPLNFKLYEGRVVSVLFTALSPAPGTAPRTWKGKEGEQKMSGSPGRHATEVSGRTTKHPAS